MTNDEVLNFFSSSGSSCKKAFTMRREERSCQCLEENVISHGRVISIYPRHYDGGTHTHTQRVGMEVIFFAKSPSMENIVIIRCAVRGEIENTRIYQVYSERA